MQILKYPCCSTEKDSKCNSNVKCMLKGVRRGQLYTYPAKRWKKKKRSVTITEVQAAKDGDTEIGDSGSNKGN